MAHERQQAGIRSFLLPLSINGAAENVACLFSQNQVVEILGPRPVEYIPGSPGYLRGVMLYHDSLLPVVDLEALCDRHQPVRQEQYRQLVVVRTGAVDPVTGESLKAVVSAKVRMQLAKISGQELAQASEQGEVPSSLRESGLVRGCFRRQGDSVVLFDLGPVVQGTYAGRGREVCR